MNIPKLIGNEELKTRLRTQIQKRGLSHAYLLSGPSGSGKHTLAQLLTAAFLCTSHKNLPCGLCQDCRKVWLHIHPDVKQVDTPTVGEVRALRKDAYIRPNEGIRKIYIIEGMEKVHLAAQNALLKVLEEGPEYVGFLLLTEDETSVLETIRSRCDILRLGPVAHEEGEAYLRLCFPNIPLGNITKAFQKSEGYLGRAIMRLTAEEQSTNLVFSQADVFLTCLHTKNAMALLECAVELEALSREEWSIFLQEVEQQLHKKLREITNRTDARLETAQLLSYLEVIRALKIKNDANVGQGHCAGLLHVLCAEVMERGAK